MDDAENDDDDEVLSKDLPVSILIDVIIPPPVVQVENDDDHYEVLSKDLPVPILIVAVVPPPVVQTENDDEGDYNSDRDEDRISAEQDPGHTLEVPRDIDDLAMFVMELKPRASIVAPALLSSKVVQETKESDFRTGKMDYERPVHY